MKKNWSRHWKKSKQPRKQRKYRHNAPLHIARKMMNSRLSKDLKKKHGKRSFPVRKGDSVKIMLGKFKGKIGKIELVDLGQMHVYVEGANRVKRDGTKIQIPIHPSNLVIIELVLDDKLRREALERK